jgi:hypothetical protein
MSFSISSGGYAPDNSTIVFNSSGALRNNLESSRYLVTGTTNATFTGLNTKKHYEGWVIGATPATGTLVVKINGSTQNSNLIIHQLTTALSAYANGALSIANAMNWFNWSLEYSATKTTAVMRIWTGLTSAQDIAIFTWTGLASISSIAFECATQTFTVEQAALIEGE